MAIDRALRPLLQSLRLGVAVVEPDSLEILFENARFFAWFKPAGAELELLPERLPGQDWTKVRTRLDQGRACRIETEVRDGARSVSLDLELRREELDGCTLIIVEAQDISKQKEAEYMLDSYSKMAEKHAREIQKEKERVEKLLLNIMPRAVYEEIKDFGAATPQRFEQASVLMLDFVDFTEMAIARDPSAIVAELNDIFSAFDRIVEMFGCERIKTIGDAYMAVSGLPEANPDHAINIARVATRMRRYIERRNASHPTQWLCRIGINTGPVIGSIVGVQKYVYDIFGPAVNLAARLEELSEPMQITLCGDTVELVRDAFLCRPRGVCQIKGFGERELWTLVDELRNERRQG
jgi:adenylate cyclase